jgi:hypothetical protein
MNEFIRKSGKRPKSIILALLLLFVPALFLSAQQSFFIPPGQTIRNGDIADGYCLEYIQKRISNDNISGLANNIEGLVQVIYTSRNRAPIPLKLKDLVSEGLVRFNAFDSYRHLQFFFKEGSGIKAIITGEEGISSFRDEITIDEKNLALENIKMILDLEARGYLNSTIQYYIWRNRIPRDIPDIAGVRTIDFQTTAKPAEQVHTRFAGGATVDYYRNGRKFMRLDGILNSTEDFSPEITELVSHFHNDHISHAVLKNLLETVNFADLFAPNVIREDSKNETFSLLKKNLDTLRDYFSRDSAILRMPGSNSNPYFTPSGGSIGDFYYDAFKYDADISVVIFKYKNPKDPNTDGAIYHITHKNVGFLLFGDFDDPRGIENLLDASAENEKRQYELEEQRSVLAKYSYEWNNLNTALDYLQENPLPEAGEGAGPDYKTQIMISALENRLLELENMTNSLLEQMTKDAKEIIPLPVLKADVVKWPHHAHIFREANSREVIIKLNEVVNPRYFIYQVHSAQDLKDFDAYIEGFDFSKKFINSGVQPVKFISLEWLKTQFLNFFTGKQEKVS